jgi:Ca2+/Na+ antiporter
VCVVLFGGRYVPALMTQYVDHHAHDGSSVAAGGGGGGDVEMATMSPRRGEGVAEGLMGESGTPTAGGAGGGHGDAQCIDTRRLTTGEQRVALSTSVKRSGRGTASAATGHASGEGSGAHDDDSDDAPERTPPLSLARVAASWGGSGGGGGGGGADASSVRADGTGTASTSAAPPAGSADGGAGDAGGAGSADEPLGSYPRQLRAWFIKYSGVRDPHAMRWALPFTAPVRLALSLTMPDPASGTVSPVHVALIAFCGPPFLLFTAGQNIFRLSDAELVWLTLLRLGLVAAALGVLPPRGLPANSSGLVSAIAFVGGVAWMDVCADEVVSIFQALGRILGLPEALLGGTIMCWAASMGDLVATLAVVKRGMANMAVTSCFAGPVFQLLCGLGCSLLFINVGRGVEVPVRGCGCAPMSRPLLLVR